MPTAAPTPSIAQPRAPFLVAQRQDGVEITWAIDRTSGSQITAALTSWPRIEMATGDGSSLRLPGRLIALELSGEAPAQLAVDAEISIADETQMHLTQAEQTDMASALPDSPLFVLREGRLRGTRVVVVALAPIHRRGDKAYVARRVRGFVHGARLWMPQRIAEIMTSRRRADIDRANLPTATPLAIGPSVRVSVTHEGMQSISGASVAATFASIGISISNTPSISFHLRLRGQPVALEIRDTQGRALDPSAPLRPSDELRFFAAQPSDRWNQADLYQLTIEGTAGLRMTRRSAVPAETSSAPIRDAAAQVAHWRDYRRYDSLRPGPDQDHWFSADMRTGPNLPPVTLTIPLSPTLPPAAGWVSLTVSGSALTIGPHHLRAGLAEASASSQWIGNQDWVAHFQLPMPPSTTAAAQMSFNLSLWPASNPSGVLIDRATWELPVYLTFGGRGAPFRGMSGVWRYHLRQLPVGSSVTLYDITNPLAPEIVDGRDVAAGELIFEDGPAPRDYLVSSSDTLRFPVLTAHARTDFTSSGADVVYLAPSAWLRELTPVLSLRSAQGYQPIAVAVEDIYATWSDGHVSPNAIRNFLRAAVTGWPKPPIAAILVGDGSADPFDYTARGVNNVNIIPPYLAMVDPWLGETACESCYAQLDGDDPLSDWLPDIMLGRWPVKTTGELRHVVSKIVRFESGPGALAAGAHVVLLADNAREADGTPDAAGDFAALADALALSVPLSLTVSRLYYDPYPPTATGIPWRESDASRAHARTRDLLNDGAAIVTYIGHANQWMWASTHWSAMPPALLYIDEPLNLTNYQALPVVLAMTCLSSAFHTPSARGSTIDEQMFLSSGGAIAVWGPTGQGVLYGHNHLAGGFFAALWNTSTPPARLGELIAAGYAELFGNGACCLGGLRTFVLLGDPLTSLRILTTHRLTLPIVRR